MSSTTPRHAPAPLLLSPADVRKLPESSVVKVDASWYMPNAKRDTFQEFKMKRLSEACYLDLDKVASDHELGLKHMMPSGEVFADFCAQAGIARSSHVVLYDTAGVFSSPRALFMFRAFGHEKSSVLDGGLPRWEAEGFPIETSPPGEVQRSVYAPPALDTSVVRDYEAMVENSLICQPSADKLAEIVVDARSTGRFSGQDPEPRPGLPSGHIPNSFSLPFNNFLVSNVPLTAGNAYTTFVPPEEVRAALIHSLGQDRAERVLSGQNPVTTTCGSGMTAAVLWLGLKLLNVDKVSLYDESWTGYAVRESSKIDRSA